jgi:hypothetical protein
MCMLTYDGVQGWQATRQWPLAAHRARWLAEVAQLSDVESDLLWLTEPLARAAAVGSWSCRWCGASAVDPADLTQWVPGMVGGNVVAHTDPACATAGPGCAR